MLVELVARHDHRVREPLLVEDPARLDGEVRKVAGIEADPDHLLAHPAELATRLAGVPDAFERVVGIDEEHAVVRHRARIGFERLALGVERHHPAMGVGAAHRDVEEAAGEHVRRRAASADVGGAARGDRAVDALGPPQPELEHLVPALPGRVADARRLGRDQGLEVDHVEEGRFDDLALEDRPDHPHQRLKREDHRSLRHRVHVQRELERAEVLDERGVEQRLAVAAPQRVEVGGVPFVDVQVREVVDHVAEACRHRVSAVERVVPEEQVKHRPVRFATELPVAAGHGELVEIREEQEGGAVDGSGRVHDRPGAAEGFVRRDGERFDR